MQESKLKNRKECKMSKKEVFYESDIPKMAVLYQLYASRIIKLKTSNDNARFKHRTRTFNIMYAP